MSTDPEAPRKPRKPRQRFSPAQRVARCGRKIAGCLRKIDQLREEIDKQVLLKKALEEQIEGFKKDRMVQRAVKKMAESKEA